jgi:hypothetical protein
MMTDVLGRAAVPQDRAALSFYVQQHQATKERLEALEQEQVEREHAAVQKASSERWEIGSIPAAQI